MEADEGRAGARLQIIVLGVTMFALGIIIGDVQTERRMALEQTKAVKSVLADMCLSKFTRSIENVSDGQMRQQVLYRAGSNRRTVFVDMLYAADSNLPSYNGLQYDYIDQCLKKFLALDYSQLPDPRGIH